MKEALTQALAKALHQAYPSLPLYTKWQETTVKRPCLFLLWERTEEKPLLGRRVQLRFFYRVSHYGKMGEGELAEEKMRQALAQVDLEGAPVRPGNVKTWVEEETVHWEGSFLLMGWRAEEESDWMEQLEWKER